LYAVAADVLRPMKKARRFSKAAGFTFFGGGHRSLGF